jgi:calcineurin-like phosphoesterase
VINLQGRTYMQPIENPFTDADALLDESSEPLPPVRLVDFHCELTSEKNAFGLHLDGGSARSSGRTPTSSPATSGSSRAGPPTRPTWG